MAATFFLADGREVRAEANDAPREGIVCIKWYSRRYRRWFRVFGFEYYWHAQEEGIWYGAYCECIAKRKQAEGRIVIEGRQCLFGEYQKIMERTK